MKPVDLEQLDTLISVAKKLATPGATVKITVSIDCSTISKTEETR